MMGKMVSGSVYLHKFQSVLRIIMKEYENGRCVYGFMAGSNFQAQPTV